MEDHDGCQEHEVGGDELHGKHTSKESAYPLARCRSLPVTHHITTSDSCWLPTITKGDCISIGVVDGGAALKAAATGQLLITTSDSSYHKK